MLPIGTANNFREKAMTRRPTAQLQTRPVHAWALASAAVLGFVFTAGVAVLFDHAAPKSSLSLVARGPVAPATQPIEVAISPGVIEVVGVRGNADRLAARSLRDAVDEALVDRMVGGALGRAEPTADDAKTGIVMQTAGRKPAG
jgi:hypothetical protein